MQKSRNGFTILELLVVIAVIGILTAVVLTITNTSRAKAKDRVITTEMKQFEILLSLEYSENKSYAKLQTTGGSFISQTWACDPAFPPPPTGSKYYKEARAICKTIVANSPANNGGTHGFLADTVRLVINRQGFKQDQKYSIMAVLNQGPYDTNYLCIGSSGTSIDQGYLKGTGCWGNP